MVVKDSAARKLAARSSARAADLAARWRRIRRWRTPLIAILSLAILLVAAVQTWGVDPAELIGYVIASVIVVVIVIALAFIFSLVLRWLRRK